MAFFPQEFEELVRKTTASLLLFARQWSHDSHEDVVQEAFMRLFNQAQTPENPTAWLFTVVRNLSNRAVRTQKRRASRELTAVQTRNNWFSQESEARSDENTKKIIDELKKLPLKAREIVVAKIWGNLTFDEIAEMLEIPRTTVYRNYQKALRILEKNCN
ncbi:MAG: RNA polymerase sigma factor [Thermoguttaceae bacterium]